MPRKTCKLFFFIQKRQKENMERYANIIEQK
jgi:hypothetical protein